MASIVINGDTSGSVTLQAPATAGATVLTLPSTSGTVVTTSGAQTIEFADGSASAPSITNSGNTNTGMFFPAADTIAFAEGGTEVMRITSTGAVSFGSSGTAYGTSGQILNSNGDAAPTWINQSSITSGACSGNAATATNLTSTRTNWSTNGVITAVVGQLAWKNYDNNHTIFDASASTSPSGGAVNNTNAQIAWAGSYPTLMGWNGVNTYGVRVDSARSADNAIGEGQTWQTVTRAFGTTYTNSTGKSIMVETVHQSPAGAYGVSLIVGGVTVTRHAYTGIGNIYVNLCAIVPNGQTYSLTVTSGSATLISWTELR